MINVFSSDKESEILKLPRSDENSQNNNLEQNFDIEKLEYKWLPKKHNKAPNLKNNSQIFQTILIGINHNAQQVFVNFNLVLK